MYFTYNNEEYKFKFTHQSNPEKGEPRFTVCTVTKGDKDEFVAQAFAKVHPRDNFDKKKGREISFGRALQEFVPKADRLAFWGAYSNWRTTEPRIQLNTKK